jgi:outer membrane protein OmpA-like peptidoglycan-associated protein
MINCVVSVIARRPSSVFDRGGRRGNLDVATIRQIASSAFPLEAKDSLLAMTIGVNALRSTLYALLLLTLCSLRSTAAETPTAVPLPGTDLAVSSDATAMEEGKALYENGQSIAAIGKFMTVLRKDPHNPEARKYLRMVVDTMRQNSSVSSSPIGPSGQTAEMSPLVHEEVRKMLQQRSLFTLDLKAIPGVQIDVVGNANDVQIESNLLFAENSGGLKEQGIPILDRIAAWLKTFGQQPIIIHCYPEELQDSSANNSLFLNRYSELFHFFVEERKLSASRFVSSDLLRSSSPQRATDASARPTSRSGGVGEDKGGGDSAWSPHPSLPPQGGKGIQASTGPAHVVIETIGAQFAMLEAMPSPPPQHSLSRWLELAILANRDTFNPEEGEWVNLDVAALTRSGLRNWSFKVLPSAGTSPQPTLYLEGQGNLLRRLSWDGHDAKTGGFVPAGSYVVRLSATDSDGTIMNREIALQVQRTTVDQPVAVTKKPEKGKGKGAKGKGKAGTVKAKETMAKADSNTIPSPLMGEGEDGGGKGPKGTPHPNPPPQGGRENEAATAAPKASVAEDAGDSAHTIWKQVIQFETGQTELKPTVKSSLERIGKTLEVYPLQKVRVTGFAGESEPKPLELARERAEAVRSILIDQYHVDLRRVIVAGGKVTSEENASKVELSITN